MVLVAEGTLEYFCQGYATSASMSRGQNSMKRYSIGSPTVLLESHDGIIFFQTMLHTYIYIDIDIDIDIDFGDL